VQAFPRSHAPIDRQLEFLCRRLAGHKVEGIEGREFQALVIALARDCHRQKPMAQRDPRATGLAKRKRHVGHRDALQPLQSEVVREFPHVALLVHNPRIEHVIDRRALPLGGRLQYFGECRNIVTTGSAGGVDQKLGHGQRTCSRLKPPAAQPVS
jgi:hypothetical protein